MGIYARHVLPRLIDLAMQSRAVARARADLIPEASGDVLEIGLGSGLNIPFYGGAVHRLWGVDPSVELWRLARRRVARAPFPVRFIQGSAERIPAADGVFDDVVMTWTLCSIPDPGLALAEIRRVLAPTGRLLFIEHGRAPEPRVLAWQDRLTPLWRRLAGGCRLNRPIAQLIRDAGFAFRRIGQGYTQGPRVFSYWFEGVAARSP